MLVLSRKIGETITIGEDILVTVLAVSGNRLRLGVSAPREISVQREEVACGRDKLTFENSETLIFDEKAA